VNRYAYLKGSGSGLEVRRVRSRRQEQGEKVPSDTQSLSGGKQKCEVSPPKRPLSAESRPDASFPSTHGLDVSVIVTRAALANAIFWICCIPEMMMMMMMMMMMIADSRRMGLRGSHLPTASHSKRDTD